MDTTGQEYDRTDYEAKRRLDQVEAMLEQMIVCMQGDPHSRPLPADLLWWVKARKDQREAQFAAQQSERNRPSPYQLAMTAYGRNLHPLADGHQMTETRFQIGDVVALKSVGPPLTVYGIRGDGLIETCWFANDDLRRDAFSPAELMNINDMSIDTQISADIDDLLDQYRPIPPKADRGELGKYV